MWEKEVEKEEEKKRKEEEERRKKEEAAKRAMKLLTMPKKTHQVTFAFFKNDFSSNNNKSGR